MGQDFMQSQHEKTWPKKTLVR